MQVENQVEFTSPRESAVTPVVAESRQYTQVTPEVSVVTPEVHAPVKRIYPRRPTRKPRSMTAPESSITETASTEQTTPDLISPTTQEPNSLRDRKYTKKQRERAPRLTNPENLTEPREPIQPLDGHYEVRISKLTFQSRYSLMFRMFFAGFDAKGRKLVSPITSLSLTALGGAIPAAIRVADELVRSNVCSYAKTCTEYQTDPFTCPKMTITLDVVSAWVHAEDDMLLRSDRYLRTQNLPLA
jgi:hypothetical protein